MDINHAHAEIGTTLHVAMMMACANWRKGVNLLLGRCANPNVMSERLGSALHMACAIKLEGENPYLDFNCTNINCPSRKTKYLFEQCPTINVNAQGGIFDCALQAAAYSGQALSVRLLLDRKARVHARTRSGKYRSALNGAIVSGHWNIVKVLLEASATPDCYLQEQPDREWLQAVLEEDGRGAVERYRKFRKLRAWPGKRGA